MHIIIIIIYKQILYRPLIQEKGISECAAMPVLKAVILIAGKFLFCYPVSKLVY